MAKKSSVPAIYPVNQAGIEKKIQDVIEIINDISKDDKNNENTKGIDRIKRYLDSLEYSKIADRLKTKLKPYTKYAELKTLIDNIVIETYEFDQANYWIDFSYSINFNNVMTITRSGSCGCLSAYDISTNQHIPNHWPHR